MQSKNINLSTTLTAKQAGRRLDQALADVFAEYSRAKLTAFIKNGEVMVNGAALTAPKHKVLGDEKIELAATLAIQQPDLPQAMALDIIYEDEPLLVLNKPAGLVVHPAAGHWENTLVNGLLYHCPDLAHLPRAGIIHRLDKDTTGLMVVAKTLPVQNALVKALAARDIQREYVALVGKEVIAGQVIDAPIGRHPSNRLKMAVVGSGKPAKTTFQCFRRYDDFTLLLVKLHTGRTHQIRVHLASKGLPLVGDKLYGWRHKNPKGASTELLEMLLNFNRQALHACRLSLQHPLSEKILTWQAPLPPDMLALTTRLTRKEGYYDAMDNAELAGALLD